MHHEVDAVTVNDRLVKTDHQAATGRGSAPSGSILIGCAKEIVIGHHTWLNCPNPGPVLIRPLDLPCVLNAVLVHHIEPSGLGAGGILGAFKDRLPIRHSARGRGGH